MQLYAVKFIPLLDSLYMFRAFYTPIIRSTIFNCIYSHWYNEELNDLYSLPSIVRVVKIETNEMGRSCGAYGGG